MVRAIRESRAGGEPAVEPQPVPDAIHDPDLEETLRRLTAPPPLPVPAVRPAPDRVVFDLD